MQIENQKLGMTKQTEAWRPLWMCSKDRILQQNPGKYKSIQKIMQDTKYCQNAIPLLNNFDCKKYYPYQQKSLNGSVSRQEKFRSKCSETQNTFCKSLNQSKDEGRHAEHGGVSRTRLMTPAIQLSSSQDDKLYFHANFKSFKTIMKDDAPLESTNN